MRRRNWPRRSGLKLPIKKKRATKKKASKKASGSAQKKRNQLLILEDFGTVDFDPQYDYKAERNRKRG